MGPETARRPLGGAPPKPATTSTTKSFTMALRPPAITSADPGCIAAVAQEVDSFQPPTEVAWRGSGAGKLVLGCPAPPWSFSRCAAWRRRRALPRHDAAGQAGRAACRRGTGPRAPAA